MNIEQYEYVDQLTQTAGAAVLISERGKMPFPYEEGISVAPGFSTSLGIRMVTIKVVLMANIFFFGNHAAVLSNLVYVSHGI